MKGDDYDDYDSQHGKDTDRIVVVEMTQLVGETLHDVRRHASVVVDDVVARRIHRSAVDRLAYHEEVKPASNSTSLTRYTH